MPAWDASGVLLGYVPLWLPKGKSFAKGDPWPTSGWRWVGVWPRHLHALGPDQIFPKKALQIRYPRGARDDPGRSQSRTPWGSPYPLLASSLGIGGTPRPKFPTGRCRAVKRQGSRGGEARNPARLLRVGIPGWGGTEVRGPTWGRGSRVGVRGQASLS